MSPLLDKPTAQKDQALIHIWRAAIPRPIPAPPQHVPTPCRESLEQTKPWGREGAGRAQVMLARGPRVPARAVPTAGPASPRTASPTPSPGVCLAMGGSNPRAPPWSTHPKILKPGGGAPASTGKSAQAERAPPAGRSRAFAHLLPTPSTRPRPRPPHPHPPAGARAQLPVGGAGSSPCLARVPGVVAGTTGGSVAPSSGSFRR